MIQRGEEIPPPASKATVVMIGLSASEKLKIYAQFLVAKDSARLRLPNQKGRKS